MTLVNTLLEPLRAEYLGALDKYENRGSKYGALSTFMGDTDEANSILSGDAKDKIKASFGNSINIPVVDYKDVTIGSTRSCIIADDENTSNLVAVTFTTYVFGFTMTPAQHYQNSVKYQEDFNLKMKMALNSFQSALDTQCINQLEADKNQFWTNVAPDYYTQAADALQVAQAEKTDFYNQLGSIMGTMDYAMDDVKVISNWQELANVRRYAAQGSGNSSNLAFQLPPYSFEASNRIVNGAPTTESTSYAFPSGSVAIINANDADAILGARIGAADSPVKEWSEVSVPLEDGRTMMLGSYYNQDCADKSALGGGANERSHVESFEFSTEVATLSAYNSNPANRYSPIVKTEILA